MRTDGAAKKGELDAIDVADKHVGPHSRVNLLLGYQPPGWSRILAVR